jgi:hypothetical protein
MVPESHFESEEERCQCGTLLKMAGLAAHHPILADLCVESLGPQDKVTSLGFPKLFKGSNQSTNYFRQTVRGSEIAERALENALGTSGFEKRQYE